MKCPFGVGFRISGFRVRVRSEGLGLSAADNLPA